MRWIVLLNLLVATAFAAERPMADVEVGQPCAQVKPVALKMLTEHGFGMQPWQDCAECYLGIAKGLRDAAGKNVSAERVIRQLITNRYPRSSGLTIYKSSELKSAAQVGFRDVPQGCDVRLGFVYSWYTAQFAGIIPLDGDTFSGNTNLVLEKSYLERLTGLLGSGN